MIDEMRIDVEIPGELFGSVLEAALQLIQLTG
jgi:hypothetical protein